MFKLVTPLVMGGASLNERSELRLASIKGVLRYWYRAVDPGYASREHRIFGGIGPDLGQSSFLLRVTGPGPSEARWPPRTPPDLCRHLGYFAYPLTLGRNQRRYIEPGQDIRLQFIFRDLPDEEARRAVLASLWLLGHVGGLGTRSRRGFGTVALREWRVTRGTPWPEQQELPLAHRSTTPDQWLQTFARGLECLRRWFRGYSDEHPNHTVLGPGARFCLVDRGATRLGPVPAWQAGLDAAAAAMRRFRDRWDVRVLESDYHRVKDHICHVSRRALEVARENGQQVTPRALQRAPARAAFGLPITFRYTSLGRNRDQRPPQIEFRGEEAERSASRLFVRVVEIGTACHPFFAWLPGPLLPPGEKVRWRLGKDGPSGEVDPPDDGIIEAFFGTLRGRTVRWQP